MTRAFQLLVGALLLLGVTLDPAARAQDPVAAPAAADETVLEAHMLDLQESMKLLRRSVRKDENRAESLGHLHDIQVALVAAKRETPRMAAGVPEAERAAFVDAYRGEMAAMLATTCALEQAVLAGDVDTARALHKELADLEEPGHERYTEDG